MKVQISFNHKKFSSCNSFNSLLHEENKQKLYIFYTAIFL